MEYREYWENISQEFNNQRMHPVGNKDNDLSDRTRSERKTLQMV
jgi:hypothetical protein